METKREVLEFIFSEIDKIQSHMLLDSENGEDLDQFITKSYEILQVTKLAIRGQYHTVEKTYNTR